MNKYIDTKILSLIVVLILVVAGIAVFLVKPGSSNNGGDEEGPVSYVSIGASNTNGYGLRGYITEEELQQILSGEVSKDDINVYGYQRVPEGGYPDLIRDHFVEKYGQENVSINQLAISSMRVEELRILLDDTYMGDSYSQWRFIGENGWFESAEEGGLEALRATYKNVITDASLITIDIGWNNFGVYVCNQLVDYLKKGDYEWSADINTIFDTEAEKQAAAESKEIIAEIIQGYLGTGELSDTLTAIFSYSILGYMHNFDICIDKIRGLNPDADIVVLGIQNLLHGVTLNVKGADVPIGDIFGNIVDMANYYISSCSPHQDKYLYVKAGENGHITIFLEVMKNYNGDAKNLNQNVKDCFDYYDNDLNLQPMLDVIAAQYIEANIGGLPEGITGKMVVELGKNNLLGTIGYAEFQKQFDDLYWPALYAGYDTIAQIVKKIAETDTLKVDSLLSGDVDFGTAENNFEKAVMAELMENVMAAAEGKEYVVNLEKIFPENDELALIVASIHIRYYIGNSFFAHPSESGHEEVKNAILGILDNPDGEKDQTLPSNMKDATDRISKLLHDAA